MMGPFMKTPGSVWSNADFPLFYVRAVNPLCSTLPNQRVVCRNAAYLIEEGIPLIITKLYKSHYNYYMYPELTWLFKEEIRIIGAINLAQLSGGYSFFLDKPCREIKYKEITGSDIYKRKGIEYIIDDIIDLVRVDLKSLKFRKITEEWWPGEIGTAIWDRLTPQQVYQLIDVNNHVLIRSLAC